MDNYFILSSKVGDKWTKVTSDMTSVKLGTCIHIVGDLAHLGDIFHGGGGGGFLPDQSLTIILTITFHEEFTVIPVHTQLSSQ
jgi:hypothetical protein